MERACAGEEVAFDSLVRECHGRLVGYLLRLTGRPDEAEELAQQTWIRAWEHKHRFRGEGAVASWLFGIGRNLYLQRGRGEARRQSHERRSGAGESHVQARPCSGLEQAEESGQVRRALERMATPVREAVWLRVVEGMKFAEVAEIQGVAVSTVHQRVAQGLQQLSGQLGELLR